VSVGLYMDHHVRSVVTSSLRQRAVDVLTAGEDGSSRLQDPLLLTRSSALGRVLFTQDDDLLAEGTRRLRGGESFAGVIYMKQRRLSDREVVDELDWSRARRTPPSG
jgi:hypothetical protein